MIFTCPSPPPEDSDYNPADEECNGRPPAILKKPAPPISSSSQGRPRRKVGRPRKYCLLEEGYSGQGLCLTLKEQNKIRAYHCTGAATSKSLHSMFLCFTSSFSHLFQNRRVLRRSQGSVRIQLHLKRQPLPG